MSVALTYLQIEDSRLRLRKAATFLGMILADADKPVLPFVCGIKEQALGLDRFDLSGADYRQLISIMKYEESITGKRAGGN